MIRKTVMGLGVFFAMLVLLGVVTVKTGVFVRNHDPEAAIGFADRFIQKVMLPSNYRELDGYMHSSISGAASELENTINGYNIFGSPTSLSVYGYQILLARDGIIVVYLKGSSSVEAFYYVVAVKRDDDKQYRLIDFARNDGMLETNDEPYETPRSFNGQVSESSIYKKLPEVVTREALLHPFGNERIQIPLKSGVAELTAVAQRVLLEPQSMYLMADFILPTEQEFSDEFNRPVIEQFWAAHFAGKLADSGVSYVQIRMFHDEYEYAKDGYPLYAGVYEKDSDTGSWSLRNLK